MNHKQLFQEENEAIKERYDLAIERIELMMNEQTVKEPFLNYFQKTAEFVIKIKELVSLVEQDTLTSLSMDEIKKLNQDLYEDIKERNYESSYANPTYANTQLGNKYGKVFSFLYTELRSIIIYAFEYRLYELTILLELFIELYNYMEEEDEFTYKDVRRALYDFMSDYCEVFVTYRNRELLDPSLAFAKDIIMESNLSDLRYLYYFGEFITKNELRTAAFLNTLPQEQIQAMANTFTEGYRLGFVHNRLDLSKKKVVNIRYQLGYERLVRASIKNFEEMGLSATIYRAAANAMNKRQHLKIGYHSTSPNKQYDYDHRFDIALFWDKAMKEKKVACYKMALEQYKELASHYAGPAVMEVFGEELFSPEDKKEALKFDKRQQKLQVDYNNQANFIYNDFVKTKETSFTIIAYPVPEIGEDFEAIFAETVKVNTLDSNVYQQIQQCLIDALDQGEYVRVQGAGENHTDLWVKLYSLKDREKETIFENCVADVNIPVGEVFTSPVLAGTKGVLHVPKVFLNDLEYRELTLTFEDGVITDYNCKNFTNEQKNKKFVQENLLYNHDTLPIGEFAIGTNTTAYMMGKKYKVDDRLPILIAEKTGPHFAIGDTCYKMSEEVKVYNPDGKEIIARDNEVSILRKTDPDKAYYNCHTDITLPYEELKEIAVYHKDGTITPIIQNGRFVLEGTLQLNEALDAK
ncbi:MAG: hypothetical protein K0S47_3724 [Herbinix sp.]|jgi:leucyl aminopeptidase (aminopeptidase T)|nr:hypothetical protein [Herbinix sp.]